MWPNPPFGEINAILMWKKKSKNLCHLYDFLNKLRCKQLPNMVEKAHNLVTLLGNPSDGFCDKGCQMIYGNLVHFS
jgi:hypothetical protein